MTENKQPRLTKVQTKTALSRLDKNEPLADVISAAFTEKAVSRADAPKSLKAKALTEAHLAALKALPDVYAKVVPETPRRLTEDELAQVVDERVVIDALLLLLDARKKTGIREALAYHLDRVAEEEGLAGPESSTDDKGHYYVRQDVEVPGTGKKVQRIVSSPKPQVVSAELAELLDEGVLTREEYLAVTSLPPVRRVFDEGKARKAVRKDPALLAKIAQAVQRPTPTITIKVENA